MERARWPRFGTVAGVVVGMGLAVALVATGVLRVPVHRDDRDASTDFLQAWSRSRNGTFVVESEFRRRLADGRTLYSASRLAQRPPDRIVRQFGGIDGTVNGHPLVCSTDQAGRYSCFAGSQVAAPHDQIVAREVATFRSYFDDAVPPGSTSTTRAGPSSTRPTTTVAAVEQSPVVPPGSVVRPDSATPPSSTTTGSVASSTTPTTDGIGGTSIDAVPPGSTPVVTPGTVPSDPIAPIGLYRVGYAPEPGCYEFFQKILYPDPPYGSYAKFCFDAETGAMTQLERRLDNGVVESLKAVKVVPQVSPMDLDTAADSDYEMRMDLGGFEEPTIPPTPGGSTAPTTAPDPEAAAVASATNAALISEGSARVESGGDASAFVDEALVRLRDGRLSINAAEWVDRGQVRALTRPVLLSLLAADIYLPPPPPPRARG